MSMIIKTQHLLLAGSLLALPGVALAHNEVTDQAARVAATANKLEDQAQALDNTVASARAAEVDRAANDAMRDDDGLRGDRDDDDDDDDGDSGKLGLLGLLGLAGLLGLKRRDDRVHVDRDVRTDTTASRGRTTRPDTDTRL